MISRHILLAAASALLLAGVAICVADGISNSNSAHPMGNIALGFDAGISLKTNTPTKYTGPGDIQSGAFAFYSLRAITKAYAALGTHPAINIVRNADNTHACDVLLAPTGGLGLTANCATGGDNGKTPLTWIGIAGTCSGTVSGATLSCTGATATPLAGQMVSGAGLFANNVSSCGAFVGGTGTCTLDVSGQTVSTPETITFVNITYVVKWYDQSGNGYDQIAPAATAKFNPTGTNGTLPSIGFGGSGLTPTTIPSTKPTYYTGVVDRTINFTTQMGVIGVQDDTLSPNGTVLFIPTSANQIGAYGGTVMTAATTDNVLHGYQGVVNGASSVISVDGTETSGNTGAGQANTQLWVALQGQNGTGQHGLFGNLVEAGAWVTTPNNGKRKQMCKNMQAYWGTANSC